jgi:hypothetical protein
MFSLLNVSTPAERIALMMDQLSLDQPGFGAVAGATKSVVNQWLSGKIKSIDARYAFKIEREKHYSAEWIMLGTGPMYAHRPGRSANGAQPTQAAQIGVSEPESSTVQKIIDCARAMSPQGQYVLLGRAEELAVRFPAAKANHAS